MKDIGRKAERQVVQMHWNTPNLIARDLAIFSLEVLSAINVTILSLSTQQSAFHFHIAALPFEEKWPQGCPCGTIAYFLKLSWLSM
jgi:hypothetical protein